MQVTTLTRKETISHIGHMTPAKFKTLGTVEQSEIVSVLLIERKLNQKSVAEKLGISIPQVSNLKTISELPTSLKKLIKKEQVSGTLVLDVIREYPHISQDRITDMITTLTEKKEGRGVTRKDVNDFMQVTDSIAEMRKFLKMWDENSVGPKKQHKIIFDILKGINEGKLTVENFEHLCGIVKH